LLGEAILFVEMAKRPPKSPAQISIAPPLKSLKDSRTVRVRKKFIEEHYVDGTVLLESEGYALG